MIRKDLLLLVCLLFSQMIWAGSISRDEARQKALQFLNKQYTEGRRVASIKERQLTLAYDVSSYYVFNIDQQDGFVVVSGDDRAPAILGYADEGTFNNDDIPENMKVWLQGYADQLAWLKQHPDQAVKAPALDEHAPVKPLLKSTWNQGSPYNDLCPLDNGSRSVTGCVATAMAQVLYYHQYPAKTTATIPAYTTWSKKINVGSIGITTISWKNMLNNYTGSETSTQKNAVAKLMQLCGSSVEMDYTSTNSGAGSSMVPLALKKYFGFDSRTRLASRGDYRARDWDNLIYDELYNKRPVLYSGQSIGGGHAFVVDGYDKDGLFHVNWGWGGYSDGYFLLSILDPGSNSGIGASTSTDGYSIEQDAVIEAQPNTGIAYEEDAVITICDINTEQKTVSKRNGVFYVELTAEIRNYCENTYTFDFGLGVYDNSGNLQYAEKQWSSELEGGGWGYSAAKQNINVPSLPDGTYQITAISRESGTNTWKKDIGGNQYFLTATISGNTMTLQAPVIDLSGSIEVSGSMEVGSKVKTTFSIDNNGTLFNDIVYLQLNNVDVGARYFEAEEGQTETLEITFTPTSTGTQKVALGYKTYYYDNNDQQWYMEFHEIASKTVTIQNAKAHTLETGITVTNANANSVINGGTLKASVSVRNTGQYAYNNDLILCLYKLIPGTNQGSLDTQQAKELSLNAGMSTQVSFQFDNLEHEAQYFMYVYYLSKGSRTQGDGTYLYTINNPYNPETEGIEAAKANYQQNVIYYNLSGQKVKKAQKGLYIVNGKKVIK